MEQATNELSSCEQSWDWPTLGRLHESRSVYRESAESESDSASSRIGLKWWSVQRVSPVRLGNRESSVFRPSRIVGSKGISSWTA